MDIIKKGISSFIFNAFGSSIGFVLMFIAARLLGAEEFGKFNYVFGYVGSFILIFCLGSSFFLPKHIPLNRNPAKLLSNTVSSSFILLLISFIPISIVIFYGSFSLLECVLIFSLTLFSVVVEHAKSYNIAINKADKAAKNYNFFLRIIALLFFLSFFFIFTESYLSLIISLVFSNLIFAFSFSKKYYKLTKPNFLLMKGSLVFYFIQLTYSLFGYVSKIFQEKFSDYETVALLSVSILIGQIITLLGTNFANVGMPIFSKFYSLGDFKNLKNKFQEITRINAFIILPIFIFIFFNTKNILLIFGEEYVKGDLILRLIVVGSFINSLVGPNGTLLLMSGKEKLELYNGFFKLLTAVIITLFLGPKYVWGIAFSIAFTDILVNILKSAQVFIYFKILPFNKKDFKFLLFLGIIQLIFFYLMSKNFENLYFTFTITIIFIIINYIFSFAKSSNYDDRKIYIKFKNFLLKNE